VYVYHRIPPFGCCCPSGRTLFGFYMMHGCCQSGCRNMYQFKVLER
jgi:hypothetical protein